jgi:hypothetical protein
MSETTDEKPWQGTHRCFHPGCNDWAPFGVNTRYGEKWYCGGEHLEAGREELTAPSSLR